MTAIEDLAKAIAELRAQVETVTRTTSLGNSSVSQAGEVTDVSDALTDAADTATALPGLQDLLDANDAAVAASTAAVEQAVADAEQARLDGVAAGELASEAADQALEKAQEALDAAAAAGGGATYSGAPPASGTPGLDGQQWFVWDSNYKITAYYVYDGATSQWVQTEITDAVLGNIDAGSITSGYIGADRIAAASLTASVLAADTLTSREIGADAILARNIKASVITGDKLVAATITGDKIAANTITAAKIQAGTITANEIAAGTVTATQINLDTLNGKTITGATIRSAASGQRIEMLGTRFDIYSSLSDTTAAGSIYGNADGAFSTITLANSYSSTTTTAKVTVPRNPGAGSVESTRQCNLVLSHGLISPVVHFQQLTVDGTGTPVIDARSGIKMRTESLVWSGSSKTVEVIGMGGPSRDQNRPRLTASDLYFITSGSPVTESPVLTPGSTTGTYTLTASDFLRTDNSSLLIADSINVPASGSGPTINGTTDITAGFNGATAGGRVPTGAWSTSSGFTVPSGLDGLWLLSLSIRLVTGGQAFYTLNGTAAANRFGFQDGSNATATVQVRLAAGDKIRLWGYSSASSVSQASATAFTATRLGS